MMSQTEVKPSQVAQLTTENAKLKALIDKLTTRIDVISNITNMVKEAIQEEMIPEITQSVQEVVEEVKEENAKLKEDNDNLHEECDRRVGGDDHDAVVAENEKLKEENAKLKAENEANELTISCLEAEHEYIDPKGKYMYIDNYSDFNKHLKENYNNDLYNKMYEWFDMDEHLDNDKDKDE